MKHLHTTFVVAWEASASITEVSVRMGHAGYFEFDPDLVRRYARKLRRCGVKLKRIARSNLPKVVRSDVEKFLDWFTQLTAAVSALHTNHAVHLDLKPENVCILPDGKPVLIDFGLVHRLDE